MQIGITAAWAKAYIAFPLAPSMFDALVRYVVKQPSPLWKSLSASNLPLSIGILSLFVMQTILSRDSPLEEDELRQRRLGQGYEFGTYGIVSFAFFSVISIIEMLSEKTKR
jgi:hypothetical protein